MPEPNPSRNNARDEMLEYRVSESGSDGALSELPGKLSRVIEFDNMDLDGVPNSKRLTLWFRNGAKRIFHIRMFRTGGRCVVEMGGLDPAQVLKGIAVCRDHFDRWFGISPRDITAYERKRDA
jgi:hypothetical protein